MEMLGKVSQNDKMDVEIELTIHIDTSNDIFFFKFYLKLHDNHVILK